MKHQLFFFLLFCIIACNENAQQNEKANIDNDSLADGIQITVTKNKDTQILITKTDTLNGKKTIEEIRPYKKTNAPDTFIVSPASPKKKSITFFSLLQ